MPVVPTYEDRGIRLDPGLNFRDNTKATPEMFGSGIGTALGSVGKGLADIGQAVSEAAIAREKARAEAAGGAKAPPDLAHVENEAAANLAVQRVAAGLVQLRNGNSETPGYGSETGTGPVDSFLRHQEDIDKFVQETRDRLTSDERAIFDGKVASIVYDAKTQGFEAQAQARKEEIPKGFWAGARTYQDQAVEAGGDEARYQGFMASGLKEIEKLGFLQRWEPEYAEQVTATYISDTRKRATLKLAEADPIEALKYSLDYATELTNADKMALHDAMEPGLKAAMKRESAHYSQANPAPDQFAATDLPPAAYVILAAIGQTEASSYDARSGGGRFDDFATYPDEIGIGGASKAGRYGLDGSTWVRVAGQAGLPDFSPASQDRAAWWLARKNYNVQTGRSLEEDISAGLWNDIRKELAPTWAGLAKLSDEDFVKLMGVRAAIANGGGQTPPRGIGSDVTAAGSAGVAPPIGAPVLTPTVQLPPEVEAVLARLPQARADDLRKAALAGVLESGQDRARADMVLGATRAEAYRQRIDSGDKTLTLREIDEDVVLKPDQKAELRPAWEAKNQEVLETQGNVEKYTLGQLKLDGYGEKSQSIVDGVWSELSTWGKTPEEVWPLLDGLIYQTGMVPSQTIKDIRQGLNSKDPAVVLAAFQQSQRLMMDWGDAVRRSDRSKTVEHAATDFRTLVDKLGPEEGVKRYIEQNDPAHRRIVDDALMNRALKRIDPQDIIDLLGPTVGASLGFTSEQRDQLLADYNESFKAAFLETGDFDRAKARAGEAIKQVYGVTYFTGYPTIMKYPPERHHSSIGGSWEWMQDRLPLLLEDVQKETNDPTIRPGEIMLEAAEGTAEAVAAGTAPIYRVYLMRRGPDGKVVRLEIGGGLFFQFDEAGAKANQARVDAAEEQRLREVQAQNALKRLAGHQDEMGLLKKDENIANYLAQATAKPAPDGPVMSDPVVYDDSGMRAQQGRISQQTENDRQLKANLDAKKSASERQLREEMAAPRLWVTSYDQAEAIEKKPRRNEKPRPVDTSYTRMALAAFRQNNWMVSLIANKTWASDDGTTDPNFDVVEELSKLKDSPYWAYRDQALNIFNRPAFEAWKAQIDMEEEDKKVLEASGVTGQVFGILASLATPETFIPGGVLAGGTVKTIMGASKVAPPAALVKAFENLVEETAKSGVQEAIFQASQETRSSGEVGKAFLSDPGRAVFVDHLSDKAKAKLLENPKTRRAVELFGKYIREFVKAAAVY